MSAMPYLSIRDLHIATASGKPLVREVNLDAFLGRVLGIIGESGSGKSLTCLAALGLLPRELSASGEIILGGAPMPLCGGRKARKTRQGRAAMIMQNPMSCFDPVFTIRSHFKETLAARGVPRSENKPGRWQAALEEAGFPEPSQILGLYPFQMSGGMLQRVMIALALVVEAPFLVADEATTDLDAASQARVLDLLEELKERRGMGILLITHDLSVIARLADEAAVMRDGRILDRGDVFEMFDNPGDAYAKALFGAHFRLYERKDASGADEERGKENGS